MKSSEIPFIKPSFPKASELIADYAEIIQNNWYTNFGPYENKFRAALESFIGQGAQVSTSSSATSGLIAALLAILGRGDGTRYILVPSFTFIAGPYAINLCGYKPLFVDIQEGDLQMNLSQVRELILNNRYELSGILLCNIFGVGSPGILDWERLAEENDLPLIIDSAAGFGSKYLDGNYIGARGDCEVFSFHATKPFAIGEGGAIASRDTELIKKINHIQNFGFAGGRDSAMLGFNGKLQEINAAIGLRQLTNFAQRLRKRQDIFEQYQSELSPYGLTFQDNAEKSSLCFCTVIFPGSDSKIRVLRELHAQGVQARDYYNPIVSRQKYFTDNPDIYKEESLEVSDSVASRIVSLPIHDDMSPDSLEKIISIVQEVCL